MTTGRDRLQRTPGQTPVLTKPKAETITADAARRDREILEIRLLLDLDRATLVAPMLPQRE